MRYRVESVAIATLLLAASPCLSFEISNPARGCGLKAAGRSAHRQCRQQATPKTLSSPTNNNLVGTNVPRSSLFPKPTALHLSPPTNDLTGDGGPSRKRDVVLSMMRQVMLRMYVIRKSIIGKMQPITRRLKDTALTTILINMLLFGFLAKDALPSLTDSISGRTSSGAATTTAALVAPSSSAPTEVSYSQFLDYCDGKDSNAHIDDVRIDTGRSRISYRVLRGDTRAQRNAIRQLKKDAGTSSPSTASSARANAANVPQINAYTEMIDGSATSDLLQHLRKNNVDFKAAKDSSTVVSTGKDNLLPTLAFGAIGYRFYKSGGFATGPSSSKGGPGIFSSKKKRKDGDQATSFDDIEGIDNAKNDVMELVDTLRNPEKYSLVGARAPTGLFLEGPPGTGKTTLARATAASADVPLISCSGSDFVEKYAGTGAARVRQLFAKAKKIGGPCIIFIDEIDGLGKKRRDSGGNGSSDEAEQTLNALLTCMDGLDSDSTNTICVLGATNRKDVLDPALVRPGRFDRIIKVDLPDEAGRERILRVHASKLLGFTEGRGVDPSRPYSLGRGRAVDLSAVAEATEGLSGAELEFVVNEAAIRAVRRVSAQLNIGVDKAAIDNTIWPEDFEASVDSFYESRDKSAVQKKGKRMGFVIE